MLNLKEKQSWNEAKSKQSASYLKENSTDLALLFSTNTDSFLNFFYECDRNRALTFLFLAFLSCQSLVPSLPTMQSRPGNNSMWKSPLLIQPQ